jgi:hypothetical protein
MKRFENKGGGLFPVRFRSRELGMAAGVSKRLWEMKDVVEMLEAWESTQVSK